MITQDDTSCDRDCPHCHKPLRLADHINRKRGRKFERRRERNRKPANMTMYARSRGKTVEHKRTRTRERRAMREGADMPLRDAPWMRWDIWNWD